MSHLSSNKTYTVTLTKGITAGGCPLSKEQSFKFTTGNIIPAPYKEGKIIANVAQHKEVSGNLDSAYSSRMSHIVNGIIGSGDYSVTKTDGIRIQIDLQNVYDVAAVELYPSEQSVHSTLLQSASVLGSKTDLDINNMSTEKAEPLVLGAYPAGATGRQMITLSAPERIRYVGLFRSSTYCAISELVVYAYVDKDFGTWSVKRGDEKVTEITGAGKYTFTLPVTNYDKDADSDYYMIVSAYDVNSKLLYKTSGKVTATKNTASTLEKSIEISDVTNVDMITAILVKSASDGKAFVDAMTICKTAPDLPESTAIPEKTDKSFADAIKFSVSNDGFTMSGKAYENGYIKPTDRINLQVLEPKNDKSGYDFATISDGDYASKLCYAKTYGMFREGEDFEFRFKVKDASKYGEYTIRVTLTREDGTTEILNEYEEILERLAGTEVAKLTINTILNNPKTIFCTPYYCFKIIQSDPDDNKFVDCAVVANAKFIVTEDHHFDILKQCSFPKVDIISLDDFMQQI
jgi:predicted nucleic acid-binding protein